MVAVEVDDDVWHLVGISRQIKNHLLNLLLLEGVALLLLTPTSPNGFLLFMADCHFDPQALIFLDDIAVYPIVYVDPEQVVGMDRLFNGTSRRCHKIWKLIRAEIHRTQYSTKKCSSFPKTLGLIRFLAWWDSVQVYPS